MAARTAGAPAAILSAVPKPMEAEAVDPFARAGSHYVRVESVGQAAGGGLLLSVAIVELLLDFWAAGWHQRSIALTVALVGAAFLTSGIAEIAVALRSGSPRDRLC